MRSLFAKAEPGSAMVAAAGLHGSAHVHAVRYGHQGTKPYRQAYGQHIGRFLSAVRSFGKTPKVTKSRDDELRDAQGRWSAAAEAAGAQPYGTSGTLGLDRGAVKSKVRSMIDSVKPALHPTKLVGAAAGMAAARYGFAPGEIADLTQAHVAEATGHIVGKVKEHPAFKRLVTRVAIHRSDKVEKELDPRADDELKNIVAGAIADTKMHPHVSYSDHALATVARSAHRQLHDRICAMTAR